MEVRACSRFKPYVICSKSTRSTFSLVSVRAESTICHVAASIAFFRIVKFVNMSLVGTLMKTGYALRFDPDWRDL
jgi:hypothetical protein